MVGDSNYYDHDVYPPHDAVDENQSFARRTTTHTYGRHATEHQPFHDEDEDDVSSGTRSVEWTTQNATTTPFSCCRNMYDQSYCLRDCCSTGAGGAGDCVRFCLGDCCLAIILGLCGGV